MTPITREQIAGLRELLAKADHLSVAGMGQMVHVEREQLRALLDIVEAVANAPVAILNEKWRLKASIPNHLAITELEGKRVAVLPLAGEVAK